MSPSNRRSAKQRRTPRIQAQGSTRPLPSPTLAPHLGSFVEQLELHTAWRRQNRTDTGGLARYRAKTQQLVREARRSTSSSSAPTCRCTNLTQYLAQLHGHDADLLTEYERLVTEKQAAEVLGLSPLAAVVHVCCAARCPTPSTSTSSAALSMRRFPI